MYLKERERISRKNEKLKLTRENAENEGQQYRRRESQHSKSASHMSEDNTNQSQQEPASKSQNHKWPGNLQIKFFNIQTQSSALP